MSNGGRSLIGAVRHQSSFYQTDSCFVCLA
jgi:hypothetical protein